MTNSKFPFHIFLCFFTAAAASAQSPVAPAETQEKAAPQLRAWILPAPGQSAALSLFSKTDASPEPVPLAASSSLVLAESYVPAVGGNNELELRDGQKVLAQSKAGLLPERYYTVAAFFASGNWQIKLFDDGPAKKTAGQRPVRVVNFAEGRTTEISADGSKPVAVGGDSVAEFELPAKVSLLAVKVLDKKGGAPAQTSTEMDLVHNPSAYVLVAPDYAGRMRPQILRGGVSTAPDVPSYPSVAVPTQATETRSPASAGATTQLPSGQQSN